MTYGGCLRRDAPFHSFVAAYALAGLLLALLAGVPHKFVPLAYLGMGASLWPLVAPLMLVGVVWWSTRSSASLAQALRTSFAVFSPRTVSGLLLFVSLSVFMGIFTSVKTMLPDMVPFFADRYMADLDAMLHGGDPWRYAVDLLPPRLTPWLEWIYFGAWGMLLPWSALAVLLAPGLRDVRAQYLWTVLIVWPLLGNVIAATTMSAGPVFYQFVTGEPRFAGLLDFLGRYSFAQVDWQAMLWKSYAAGEAGAGFGISAFPSLHLANATLFMLLAARVHRWLLSIAVVFLAVILFSSVHLGWHYAIDGYFSIAATILIWKLVGRATEKIPRCDGCPLRCR